jgi:hypothetical protein
LSASNLCSTPIPAPIKSRRDVDGVEYDARIKGLISRDEAGSIKYLGDFLKYPLGTEAQVLTVDGTPISIGLDASRCFSA